jgi:hypothetical protein
MSDQPASELLTSRVLDYAGMGFLLVPPDILVLEVAMNKDAINWPLVIASFIGCYVVGIFLLTVGLKWEKIKPKLSENLANSVGRVARSGVTWAFMLIIVAFGPVALVYVFSTTNSVSPKNAVSQGADAIRPSSQQSAEDQPLHIDMRAAINAKEAIQRDLEAAKQQVASLQSQLAIAIRERDTAQQSASSKLKTPLDTVPNFALTYTLRDDQIKNLAEQFFEIKDQMPSGIIIQAFGSDNISYGMGQQLAQVFGRANLNFSIEQTAPLSPKEVGITIRVGDAQSIPDGAKKTAQIFKNVLGVDVPFMSDKSLNGNTFRIFTGPRP